MNAAAPNNDSGFAQPPSAGRHNRTSAVWWVIAVSLAVIAFCLVVRVDDRLAPTTAAAQNYGGAGARGVFAFPSQMTKTTYGLYMVDVDTGTVWCYEYTAQRKLRLSAARSWRFDRYLERFNIDAPSPEEVEQMVELERQAKLQAAQPTP